MRGLHLITFLLFFSINISFSNSLLYKTWIGEHLEYLQLKRKNANFDYGNGLVPFKVSYKNQILTLTLDKKKGWIYSFKVIRLTNDSLIISSLDSNSLFLTNNKHVFVFINKKMKLPDTVHFESLLFEEKQDDHYKGFKLFIDATGLMYLEDPTTKGNANNAYKGKLNPDQLNQLFTILKSFPLEKFPSKLESEHVIGPSEKVIVFHYDHTSKISKGRWVPHTAAALLDYILDIREKRIFEKNAIPFKFEI